MAKTSTLTDAQKAAKQAEKAAKFIELATARVTKALAAINNVQRLANKNSYGFDEVQAKKINDVLGKAVDDVEDAFDTALKGGKAKTGGFTF